MPIQFPLTPVLGQCIAERKEKHLDVLMDDSYMYYYRFKISINMTDLMIIKLYQLDAVIVHDGSNHLHDIK